MALSKMVFGWDKGTVVHGESEVKCCIEGGSRLRAVAMKRFDYLGEFRE